MLGLINSELTNPFHTVHNQKHIVLEKLSKYPNISSKNLS